MPTRNANLTDHYDQFIEQSVEAGRFGKASEAVRAGLQLLEREDAENKAKLEWLRGAAKEAFDALDRGEGIPVYSLSDVDRLVEEALTRTRARRRLKPT